MRKLYDLARVTTATVGTGTLTLGAPVVGFLSFATAGVSDGDVVPYGIRSTDGSLTEAGYGTYAAAGPTLTRVVTSSTNGGSPVALGGASEVFVSPLAVNYTAINVAEHAMCGGL
jgi:hypothetical protein